MTSDSIEHQVSGVATRCVHDQHETSVKHILQFRDKLSPLLPSPYFRAGTAGPVATRLEPLTFECAFTRGFSRA